jgi:hypothetical protein
LTAEEIAYLHHKIQREVLEYLTTITAKPNKLNPLLFQVSLKELKIGGEKEKERRKAPYHIALSFDQFRFYRDGKNYESANVLKSIRSIIVNKSLTKMVLI